MNTTNHPGTTDARHRTDLLAGATQDARAQVVRVQSRNPGFPDIAVAAWRERNPNLSALLDHSEGGK